PIVSYAGPAAAALLTGSIIVETIFQVPGVGRYFVEAALNRDYTLVMGTVVVIAIFTIVFNLIVDLRDVVVAPRVSYDGSRRCRAGCRPFAMGGCLGEAQGEQGGRRQCRLCGD